MYIMVSKLFLYHDSFALCFLLWLIDVQIYSLETIDCILTTINEHSL